MNSNAINCFIANEILGCITIYAMGYSQASCLEYLLKELMKN